MVTLNHIMAVADVQGKVTSAHPLYYCFTAGIVLYCDPILG